MGTANEANVMLLPDPNSFDSFADFLNSQESKQSSVDIQETLRQNLLFRSSKPNNEQLANVFLQAWSEWMKKDFLADYYDKYRKPLLSNARFLLDLSLSRLRYNEGCQDFPYLHFLCKMRAPLHIIEKLIEVGGKDLVLQAEPLMENTVLFSGIGQLIKQRFIEVGGKELVMKTNALNVSALTSHISVLVRNEDDFSVVQNEDDGDNESHTTPPITEGDLEHLGMFLEVGGKDLVLVQECSAGLSFSMYGHSFLKRNNEQTDLQFDRRRW